jgi:NAD(P)-dependent dehydrogenase (short-subunit alcohol dehydrogenase family)
VIHYRSSETEAESLAEEIAAMGGSASLIKADLSDPAQVQPLVEQAADAGALFALINNASIFAPVTWEKTTLESWQQHLTVNLTAPFLLSQAFARHLPPGASGRIVNLLDWRALRPGADHLPYTISKAALAALTRSLAVAFAPRITVNGLALGAALPPNEGEGESVDQAQLDRIIADVPAKRWADIDEVCRAMLFLLDGPEYITGEIIHVDGGRHLV